jgi:hypothetical protein
VVDVHYPYNAIFDRGLLNTFEAALHSTYLCLKVPTLLGVIPVHGSQKDARNIKQDFAPGHRNVNYFQEEGGSQQDMSTLKTKVGIGSKAAIEPKCETKRVPLDRRVSDKAVIISQDLTTEEETELLSFWDNNSDVFTWNTSDLMSVSRSIIKHNLHINPSAKPRKQKLPKMPDEKIAATKVEVQRLLDAGFIREVQYPTWLANVVMVKKKNDKWRMCMNFTNLNKCYLKDDFPLSRIDKVVDSVIGCKTMALMDCFSGYHQIWLGKEDEEKMSFITPFNTYCYLRMPEGLKNVGPTFCRMMKAILKD